MVYRYDPKRKYFLVSMHLENKPGALGNLANVLGIRGVNILEGFFGGITYGESGTISFFLESTNARMDADWLKDFLKSLVYVSGVEVKAAVEGFLSDSLNYPVTWNNGDRAVLMRIEGLRSMLGAIRTSNPEGGDQAIRDAGFGFGRYSWPNLFGQFHPKTKEGLGELLNIYTATGWGRVEVSELSLPRRLARIKLVDGFECTGLSTGKAESHFMRGHLEAGFSVYFGVDMKAEESRCVSKGDSHCEFEISPRFA